MLEVKTEVERLEEQVVRLSRDLADSVRDYLDLRDRCNNIFLENEMLKEKLEKYKNELGDINRG